MTQPLFFEPDVPFEKMSAETMLPEDPNTWPNEIMQELFKQVPYCADFAPHVTMDKVDAERGFGFGNIEIQNKTEIQHGAEPEALSAAGIQSARIPIIIKDRRLQPFDLIVTADSKIVPLTEPRLRSTLFRPQAFDITGRGPGDMSMIGQLYPPYRQNYGFGGGGATMNVGMGKEGSTEKAALSLSTVGSYLKKQTDPQGLASASRSLMGRGAQKMVAGGADAAVGQKLVSGGAIAAQRAAKFASVLTAILPTIWERDYESFHQKIASNRGLQAQFTANGPATFAALSALAEYTPKTAAAVSPTPSVVQLVKTAGGYILKSAQHAAWAPESFELDRGAALRLLGSKVVLAADTTGAATMALGEGAMEAEADSPEADSPELVSQFGMYKVQDTQGRHLVGYVFTNLIDTDGTALPIALFTNGSQMAVQSDIVGVSAGTGAGLFSGPPSGYGAFYRMLPNGSAEATVPLRIQGTADDPEQGGATLHCETFDGRPVLVSVQSNIQKVMPSPDGDHLMVPDSFAWLPLDKAEETELVGDPAGFNKEARVKRAFASVTLRCGGDTFSVSGFPVEKIASSERQFLNLGETLFLLAGLGANLDYAQTKIGEAAAWHAPVEVVVGRSLTPISEIERAVKEAQRADYAQFDYEHWRADLVKEAAVIPDPMAVDTVLSLGFLNPENLGIFIGSLPDIEAAQQKMCELLLAARLGLREISATALESAIRGVETTLEGLKVLAFSNSE